MDTGNVVIVGFIWTAAVILVTYIVAGIRESSRAHFYLAQEKKAHAETQRRLDGALILQSTAKDLGDILVTTLNSQYQARLDQADARLDDHRIYTSRLEEENKALLDKCLQRNGYTPVHHPVPRMPMNTTGLGFDTQTANPPSNVPPNVKKAQDEAAAAYQAYMREQANASNGNNEASE